MSVKHEPLSIGPQTETIHHAAEHGSLSGKLLICGGAFPGGGDHGLQLSGGSDDIVEADPVVGEIQRMSGIQISVFEIRHDLTADGLAFLKKLGKLSAEGACAFLCMEGGQSVFQCIKGCVDGIDIGIDRFCQAVVMLGRAIGDDAPFV